MPTKAELTHYRLQAMLRENSFDDLKYLGDLPGKGHTYRIGEHLFTDYLLQFELASVLLLMAMIGAIVLARRDIVGNQSESENQNIIQDCFRWFQGVLEHRG